MTREKSHLTQSFSPTSPRPAFHIIMPPDLQLPAVLPPGDTTGDIAPLAQSPAAVYLAGLSKGSRRTMQSALAQLAQALGYADALSCPWASLRYAHTTAIRSALQERYAPATANRMLAALRRVLEEAWRLGLMEVEVYERAADLKVIKAERLPAGRALTSEELGALLDACAADSTPAGVRDAAIIAVLVGTGLRRSEAVALDMRDYEAASGALLVRSGKGRKDRMVYVVGGAATALTDWLTIRGTEAGPLFLAATKGGHATTRRLTDGALALMLSRRAAQAHVPPFTPHDLRRTHITHLLDSGADIATVQKLAGHADPATTARYDRRGEATKKDAAALLDIPHIPRRTLPLDD